MEIGGSGGCLVIWKFQFATGYVAKGVGNKDVGKLAFVPSKLEKGKQSMDLMVEYG